MSFRKILRCVLVTLFCLMLVSPFAGVNVPPVKAYEFTITATITSNPYWGYYGGYHVIWQAIKNDLAAIGINVEIRQYDAWNWWNRVWEDGWNKSWAEGGWDMFINEWWLRPHALDPWFTSLVRSDLTPVEGGYNIFPWNNSDADDLLRNGMTEFNALTRQTYLWNWQEVFMQDPPWINLYYPILYEVMGRYLTGYDPTATGFYDTAHLTLNNTMLAEARPDREPNTAIYACSEPLWWLNPMFMATHTEEIASTLQWGTLYKWSCDPFPTDGSCPGLDDYAIVPDMAADYPTYLNNDHTVRVTLRDGMVWRYNNGTTVPINADDVVWTFETVMDPQADATGRGDFIHVIDNVTKVDNLTVDFNLKYACPDILSILSNDWGTGCILPKHKLASIPLTGLWNHATNWDYFTPSEWLPVSGPFMMDPANPPDPDTIITLIKNPSYYGYNASIVGTPAWGPYNIDKLILLWIKDPATRLIALMLNDIDFGEYPTAPVLTFKDLNDTVTYPYLRVTQYDYPASNPIWLNFNNEYLSNRYIRMAIAHAIDYDYIINTLLPPWGIETAIRGKTPILPHHYYTDENDTKVHLFNEVLPPYMQNVTKALEYMDLWKGSTTQYDLTISVDGSGSTDPAVGVHTYDEGEVVSVTATAAAGWTFDHWELDTVDVGTDNPYSVTMDADKALTAFFTEIVVPTYDLTISVDGSGSTDPAVGVHTYDEGEVVSVTATAAAGWTFDHWELDGNNVGSTNPICVTMDQDHTLFAVFIDAMPPIAEAGMNQTVDENTVVTLDGSNSTDNVEIVSYIWTFIDVTPQTLTGITPTYTFTDPGVYLVTLNVSDSAGNYATDTVTITVLSSPEDLMQRLIETIETWNLPAGTEKSLTSKLEETIHLLNKGNDNGAVHKLMDFINQVEALRDKGKLENWQADYLISEAQRIIDLING